MRAGKTDIVDASTLTGKFMFGYQGWYKTPTDGSSSAIWRHWFGGTPPTDPQFDYWPDLSEFSPSELSDTGLDMPDGSPAYLYSALTRSVVMRHFSWMRDYGLDGVFLQRFTSSLSSSGSLSDRNVVAGNVKASAEATGRTFAMMYDISGQNASTLVSTIINDWKMLVDTMQLTSSSRYLNHQGKPIVAIWGFGFADRPGTPTDLQAVLDFFHNDPNPAYRATVMGGVDNDWTTNSTWAVALRGFDIISPWAVGRYASLTGATNFIQSHVPSDLTYAAQYGIEYLPVIFPGFSFHNSEPTKPLNEIPRRGGTFLWQQSYDNIRLGATMLYGAMFDEVSEGTAFYKQAVDATGWPSELTMVPLRSDGYTTLPNDWYLQLSTAVSETVRGTRSNQSTMPITPPDAPVTPGDPVEIVGWQWYNDAADASMTPLSSANSAPTLTGQEMQNTVLRLRVAISGGAAGSIGSVDLQYDGESAVWRSIEGQTVTSNQEGVWFRWANATGTSGSTITTRRLTSSTVSGKYHESVSVSETFAAGAVTEIDLAVLIHWPPADTPVKFRVLVSGAVIPFATGVNEMGVTTSPAADRPNTVVRLDGDTSSKTSREIRFAAWQRSVYHAASNTWWLFLAQFRSPTILRSYYRVGTTGSWTIGPTQTFTLSGVQGNNNFAFRAIGTSTMVYGVWGNSSSTRWFVRGVINASGVLSWGSPVSLAQASDRHRAIDVDDAGYIWCAGIDEANGVWIRRSTSPDDLTAWQPAITTPDISVASGDVISVIGLSSNRCLVLWRGDTGSGSVPLRYAYCSNTSILASGSASSSTSTSTEDWGVTRDGDFVYLIHSNSFTAGGAWQLRIFRESTTTWTSGPTPGVSGQPSTNDGIAVSEKNGAIYAFGTFAGTGGQDRIIRYVTYSGGLSGTWSALSTLTPLNRINGDHMTAPRHSGNGDIVLFFEHGDDDITGNARGVEAWVA